MSSRRPKAARSLKPDQWPYFDRILLDQAMAPGVDSLNVATASGIALYHLQRVGR